MTKKFAIIFEKSTPKVRRFWSKDDYHCVNNAIQKALSQCAIVPSSRNIATIQSDNLILFKKYPNALHIPFNLLDESIIKDIENNISNFLSSISKEVKSHIMNRDDFSNIKTIYLVDEINLSNNAENLLKMIYDNECNKEFKKWIVYKSLGISKEEFKRAIDELSHYRLIDANNLSYGPVLNVNEAAYPCELSGMLLSLGKEECNRLYNISKFNKENYNKLFEQMKYPTD